MSAHRVSWRQLGRVLATLACAGGALVSCSPPMPDRLETRYVDVSLGEQMQVEIPSLDAIVWAEASRAKQVTCQATGPGDKPARTLRLFSGSDAYRDPYTRDGVTWAQVGAITGGPGRATLSCTGPAGTPVQVALSSPPQVARVTAQTVDARAPR